MIWCLRLALLVSLAAASACGPIYNTEYRYVAPEGGEASACLERCDVSKKQCRVTADLRAENAQLRCERDARDDYERCLANAQGEAGRSSCTRRSCSRSSDSGECKSDYDICFQACGGVINSERVCSFNCPTP